MDRTMNKFLKYQEESEARFVIHEDERWEKEQEIEDKRRKEEREHEMRMMAMIANMFRPAPAPPPQPYAGPRQDFDEYYSQL